MSSLPPTNPNPTLAAARAYVGAGLSVIPVGLDGTKQPAWAALPRVPDPDNPDRFKGTWKPYQESTPTADEVTRWFGGRSPWAIAVVCGAVSGGVELIDLDAKDTAKAFLDEVNADYPGLLDRLSLEETPAGVHVWYKCRVIQGNTKLAQRPDGVDANGRPKVKTLIETRGEGGYAVVAGSPPAVHDLGKRGLTYRHGGGPPLTGLQEVTPEERDYLFRTAMSFDRSDERHRPNFKPPADAGLSPADDFDRRGPAFSDLLPDATFSRPGRDEGNVRRPDKERGNSGTVGHCRGGRGEPLLKVFSSNWPPFEPGKVYGKFHALRLTKFGGDGRACTIWLRSQGYGDPLPPKSNAGPTAGGGKTPPPPGPQPAAPAEWPPPIPLDDPSGTPPPFPLDTLPPGVVDLCQSSAEAVGCPVDYPASHALAVAAGATGAAYDLQIKRGFYAPSSLWVCVVAPPGSGKSPSVAPVLRPVFEEQARRRREGVKNPAYVSDVTIEKLAQFMTADDRGLLMVWDEMAGWLSSFNQYKAKGAGNDRAHYLSVWDGRAFKVDRKSPDSPEVFVHRPRLSICGGIQPQVLDAHRGGPEDGLFDRFLFAFPADRGLPVESFAEADDAAADAWSVAVGDLWKRAMHEHAGGSRRPNVVHLNDGGRPVWQAWTRELSEAAAHPDAPPYFRTVGAKLSGYAARLALVCHLLREAYGERPGTGVGADDMGRGVRLARYFLAHADRVHRAAGRDDRLNKARAVLRWAVGSGEPTFTRSSAWANLRRNSLFKAPEDLAEPIRLLSAHQCVRWSEQEQNPLGRPHAGGCYRLNPFLLNGNGGID